MESNVFTKTWLKDAGERVVATFVEGFAGLWVLQGATDSFNFDFAKKAAAAGVIAAAALIKSLIAAKLGNKDSASLNPDLAVVDVKPNAVI
jgi:uncharacterized membrane protein YjjP (DUF1212 family)